MLTAFSIFRLCNVLYQVIATFVVYWLQLCWSSFPALFREWLWLLFLLIIIIIWFKKIKPYWKLWKQTLITFIVLIVVSVLFSLLINDTSLSNIFIWIKYGFRWTFILISASFFWFVISDKFKGCRLLNTLPWVLVSIVVLWFLWQWAKLLFPDFFTYLWYGRLDDYVYGSNPPIYYLTWYQWTLRWQWFFSWPNNYWYFLVAFLPLVWWFFTNNIKKKEYQVLSIIALIVWIAWMVATLSRAVLVGMVVVFILLYRKELKKRKRLLLRWWAWILVALILLSVFKRESTIWHITSKLDTIPEIISAPLWYWLWSSWPAVHYEWKYLPENYYLQIMLDIGTIWFLFRVVSILYLLWAQYKVVRSYKWNISDEEEFQLMAFRRMQIWLLALLVMWLFLHVFEDSMVNYLFFTVYGIILWSLSTKLKGELWWKIKIEKK